jgi:hypothetical protein
MDYAMLPGNGRFVYTLGASQPEILDALQANDIMFYRLSGLNDGTHELQLTDNMPEDVQGTLKVKNFRYVPNGPVEINAVVVV